MNIEDRIRTELEAAVSTVPAATPAPLDVVEKRGRRRLIVTRVGLAAAGVAVFAGIVGVSIAIGRIGYLPDVVAPTTTERVSGGTVVIAGDEFRVDGLVEAFSEVPMYFGQASPSARFDTAALGEEQPLELAAVKVADADVLDGPTIYVGEVDDESIFVNARSSDSFVTKCLWIGPTPQFCGDWGAFELSAPAREGSLYGVWLGVPDGTSVVVLRDDGRTLAWQRPVGDVTLIALPDSGVYSLVALDEAGGEIEVIEIDAAPFVDGGTTTPGDPTTTLP
jgi:hypothetical protein